MTRTNPDKTPTLVCQECGGMGGYTEIAIPEWCECTWCEGTGRVTPQVRSQWIYGYGGGKGECRARYPMVSSQPWPITSSQDWCAKFDDALAEEILRELLAMAPDGRSGAG